VHAVPPSDASATIALMLWCDAKGAQALPAAPETVAAYLASQAGTSKELVKLRT
jgi:hypothetical protein